MNQLLFGTLLAMRFISAGLPFLLCLLPAQNVGIGTTTPLTRLEAFGADVGIIVHYAGQSRGGIWALSGQRVALATTAAGDNLYLGYGGIPVTSTNFVPHITLINATGNVGIGTTTPQSKLTIRAVNASTAGPHIWVYTDADNYPLFQNLNWSHDNVSLNFDAYYDGAWRSSHAGSNFQMYKFSNQLRLNYASGAAPGSPITWNIGIALLTNGNVGIGTPSPHPSARLHVQGTGTQGVLLPQVALTNATNWAPLTGADTDGMLVYNTATSGLGQDRVTPGYYYRRAGRWQRFTENGYAGLVQGVLSAAAQNLTTNAPSWQYLNSYIDLPPGRWIVFSTQLINPTSMLSTNASIWIRTSFSDSPTTYSPSPDIIGSTLISGLLPAQSVYSLVIGQVIIHNTGAATKRYYYWGHKDPYNATQNLVNFSTTLWGENQLFALPAE
ncbi:MAG: hypothetical protein N2170_08515 [Bacteroidia bacterium]|nr:hypothetical protein [Bacteroidia bacterium]